MPNHAYFRWSDDGDSSCRVLCFRANHSGGWEECGLHGLVCCSPVRLLQQYHIPGVQPSSYKLSFIGVDCGVGINEPSGVPRDETRSVSDSPLALRANGILGSVVPYMSCAQVVPIGVGDPCRSVHRALGDRMRPLHWCDLIHSRMESLCEIHVWPLAKGRRSVPRGHRSSSQSEELSIKITDCCGRCRPSCCISQCYAVIHCAPLRESRKRTQLAASSNLAGKPRLLPEFPS